MKAHYTAKHPGRTFPYNRREHTNHGNVSTARTCVTVSRSPRFSKTSRKSHSRATPVSTPDHPLAPITPLKSPTPIYLEDFPSTSEREAMVSLWKRNLLTSPQRHQTQIGSGNQQVVKIAAKEEEKSMHRPALAMISSLPDSPYEPCLGYTCVEVPPYHPTPVVNIQPCSPPRKVELLRPASTYIVMPIHLKTWTPGALYEHTNLLPYLHDDDMREAFVGVPSIYSNTSQSTFEDGFLCIKPTRHSLNIPGIFRNNIDSTFWVQELLFLRKLYNVFTYAMSLQPPCLPVSASRHPLGSINSQEYGIKLFDPMKKTPVAA
ncbi:hypothetical protein CHS0354_042906 [Potamilus streckersoni]|uniref:Uncharacterized protein n=1 Tax=Potamilus streckersoni TaxID=2493646 RepID=A0AAE0T5C2_9BIVA|nr:hypothetical protein CHS0354_042906 [Potamilus streckersoni]